MQCMSSCSSKKCSLMAHGMRSPACISMSVRARVTFSLSRGVYSLHPRLSSRFCELLHPISPERRKTHSAPLSCQTQGRASSHAAGSAAGSCAGLLLHVLCVRGPHASWTRPRWPHTRSPLPSTTHGRRRAADADAAFFDEDVRWRGTPAYCRRALTHVASQNIGST